MSADTIVRAHPPAVGATRGRILLAAITNRLVLGLCLVWLASSLTFVLVALTPGDAARFILGPEAAPSAYYQMRHELGLDRPLPTQYAHWLERAVRGDLGSSLVTGEPVLHAIRARIPVTLSLIVGALIITIAVGVPIGILGATSDGLVARCLGAFSLVGFALPAFWLGAILIAFFAVDLKWVPATGYVPLSKSPTQWFLSLVLPVIAIGVGAIAIVGKQTREAMLESLASDYVRAARASGVSRRSILLRHALKNAAIRILTVLGLLVVGLLGGTVFVESLFALPGLGGLAVSATSEHDLPMIQGVVVLYTLVVIAVNTAIDFVYVLLDPRVGFRA